MTAVREAHLWCDGRDPDERYVHGRPCGTEFRAPASLGFVSSYTILRREAKKAGWAFARHPRARFLDKDFCPAHNPDRKPATEENP